MQGPWLPASILLPNLITLQKPTLTNVLPVFSQDWVDGSPFPMAFTPISFRLSPSLDLKEKFYSTSHSWNQNTPNPRVRKTLASHVDGVILAACCKEIVPFLQLPVSGWMLSTASHSSWALSTSVLITAKARKGAPLRSRCLDHCQPQPYLPALGLVASDTHFAQLPELYWELWLGLRPCSKGPEGDLTTWHPSISFCCQGLEDAVVLQLWDL